MERAVQLSPRDPQIGNWESRIGLLYLVQSRIDDATSGSKRRASLPRIYPGFTFASPPPIASKAKPSGPPQNSPKSSVSGAAASRFEHRPAEGRIFGTEENRSPLRNHFLRRPAQGWGARAMKTVA